MSAIDQSHRIVSLTVENVKRIQAVSITPGDAGVVEIAGRNGQGKSSVLDSIEYALAGTSHLPKQPIRNGTHQGRVVVDLGDITVERVFRLSGSTLVVRGKDGAKHASPQTLLDKLFNSLSFDPLAFTRMKPMEQRETLLKVAGVSFADLEKQRDKLYAERTEATRDWKRLQVEVNAIPIPAQRLERVDVAELVGKLEEGNQANRAVDAHARRLADLEAALVKQRELVQRLQAELKAANEKGRAMAAEFAQLAETAPEPVDVKPIQAAIAQAGDVNAAVDMQERRAAKIVELENIGRVVETIQKQIDKIDAQKAERLAQAKIPIEGLSVRTDGVVFNGIPYEQASSAEQLRVSCAMGIAANPNLRVMLLRDGSLLDEESLAALRAFAEENDAQIWVERVDSSGATGVVIEDGAVVKVNEPEVPSAT